MGRRLTVVRYRARDANRIIAHLTSVVARFAAGAKAAGRQYEYLLGDGVYLAYALGVADHRYIGFSDSQRDRARFTHVPVPGHRAPLTGRVADPPSGQAHQAHAVLELGLPVQLEQRDVVVQRLRIVIVMDVRGGHPEGLRTRAPVFPGQVVITHPYVDGVSGSHDAENPNRSFIPNRFRAGSSVTDVEHDARMPGHEDDDDF